MMMKFYKITDIEFDFDYEDITLEEQNEVIEGAKACLWDARNEDDLCDVISDNTGWFVKSFSYDVVR